MDLLGSFKIFIKRCVTKEVVLSKEPLDGCPTHFLLSRTSS